MDGWQRWVPLKTSNVALSFGVLLRSHWLISMLVSSMSIVATPLNIDNAETLTFFIIHYFIYGKHNAPTKRFNILFQTIIMNVILVFFDVLLVRKLRLL